MVKYKNIVFIALIIFFLLFSFYPTIFELQRKDKLTDRNREFILEHNYYWPDYNLYLSKIRQGIEGRLTALERYTSEPHQGSLIQEFYVTLGWLGKVFNLDPNSSYLLGRILLSPLLLLVIILLSKDYFPSFTWQILAFLITIVSGSFPRIFTDSQGITHIGRFMEWWSNIDALQRITFIPHILFGQVASFYLLYQLVIRVRPLRRLRSDPKFIIYILLGNLVGLTFPPSLIILNTVLILLLIMRIVKQPKIPILKTVLNASIVRFFLRGDTAWQKHGNKYKAGVSEKFGIEAAEQKEPLIMIFIILTLPSLLYIFLITKFTPWSALVEFHRTHPMMIPFDQYILGSGPIIFLGFFGAVISIIKRDKIWQPMIFWVLSTFGFAAVFSVIRDQSPLRFTQTGLFIPLGILGAYFFYQLFQIRQIRLISLIGVTLYLLGSFFIMKTSLDWQTSWLSQKIGANIPPVPYPPQSMYPLREWMEAIRWLRNNTNHNNVVLAEITAGNYIPAYSGNTVYFGQSNTVDYNRKELEVDKFFSGEMSENEAQIFLKTGRIKYIFFSLQEKEKAGGKDFILHYPLLKRVYANSTVAIFEVFTHRE